MSDVQPTRRDTLDAIVIVVPPALERGVPKRRYAIGQSPDLTVPLFMFIGLPLIALVGVGISLVLASL